MGDGSGADLSVVHPLPTPLADEDVVQDGSRACRVEPSRLVSRSVGEQAVSDDKASVLAEAEQSVAIAVGAKVLSPWRGERAVGWCGVCGSLAPACGKGAVRAQDTRPGCRLSSHFGVKVSQDQDTVRCWDSPQGSVEAAIEVIFVRFWVSFSGRVDRDQGGPHCAIQGEGDDPVTDEGGLA